MALVPGTRTCPSIPITVLEPASMTSELTYGPWRQNSGSCIRLSLGGNRSRSTGGYSRSGIGREKVWGEQVFDLAVVSSSNCARSQLFNQRAVTVQVVEGSLPAASGAARTTGARCRRTRYRERESRAYRAGRSDCKGRTHLLTAVGAIQCRVRDGLAYILKIRAVDRENETHFICSTPRQDALKWKSTRRAYNELMGVVCRYSGVPSCVVS